MTINWTPDEPGSVPRDVHANLEQAVIEARANPHLIRHLPNWMIPGLQFEVLVGRLQGIEDALRGRSDDKA